MSTACSDSTTARRADSASLSGATTTARIPAVAGHGRLTLRQIRHAVWTVSLTGRRYDPLLDTTEHVPEERIPRDAREQVGADDQHTPFATRGQRSEIDAIILLRIGRGPVQPVRGRKRQRDMRQRIDVVWIVDAEAARLFG